MSLILVVTILLRSIFLFAFRLCITFTDSVTTEALSEIKTHFIDEQTIIVADISNNRYTQQNFALLLKQEMIIM